MSQSLKQQTATGLKWSAIERFANQLVNFTVSVLLARMLLPATYGLVSMVAIFIAISSVFVNSGFSQALVRKQNRTNEDDSTAFYFNIVVGVLFYLMLYFTAPLIAKFYEEPQLINITRVVGLVVPINSLIIVQRAILMVKMDFKTQSKASVTSSIISGVIGLGMAWKGFGVWALVSMQVLGCVINAGLIWSLTKWKPLFVFSRNSLAYLWGFGSKLLASSLIDTIYNNLLSLVIGKVYSATDLGYYGKAAHFASTPSSTLTGVIQQVAYPAICKIQDEKERLAAVYRHFIKLAVFVVFPLMTGLAAVSHSFVILLLGDNWAFAGELLLYLCFGLMWIPVHAINLNPLQALGRSDLFLRLEVVKKVIGVLIIAITVPFGIKVMTIGGIISSVLSLFVNTYYNKDLINVSIWTQLKDIAPTFTLSMVMFAIVMVYNRLIDNLYVEFFGGMVLGAAIFLCGALLFRFEELREIVKMIKDNLLK